ncbi:pyroglutamyl-peptidase 1 [Electrophorus electricus]|uniref:pyroglutamyl-peptidase 1 n=1 Tax=Electrophorus electricus TaxID=8005 RepID=UPI0015D01D58|nr:pyroglutamyl-peptidase 1 [Electrophorus electricus]
MGDSKQDLVLVTEFGPFRQCLVNPSWEAAKGWKITGLGEGIEAQTAEIPVSYAKAQQILAEIWQNMKPKVAVHLGIAPGTKCIILEQTAKNHDYKDRDVCGFCPAGNFCIEGGAEQLDSIISMRSLAKHLKGQGIYIIYSRDAGRYLCDFVYYCSLYYGQRRAALIHVPVSGSLAHPDRLVPQLQAIILALLQQLDKHSSSPTKSTCSAG